VSLTSKVFCYLENSLSKYTELAGVAKNFLASLIKPSNHAIQNRIQLDPKILDPVHRTPVCDTLVCFTRSCPLDDVMSGSKGH